MTHPIGEMYAAHIGIRLKRWLIAAVVLTTAGIGAAILFAPLRAFGGLESPCNFISDLVSTNPLSSDLASTSDDHHRCIKAAVKGTFANVNAAVTSTDEELNIVDGVTLTAAQINDAARLGNANSFNQTNTFTATTGIHMSGSDTIIKFSETDQGTDDKSYRFQVGSNTFALRLLNDAESATTDVFIVDRTAMQVDTVTFPSGSTTFSKAYSSAPSGPALILSSSLPLMDINETDGSTNNKRWRFYSEAEGLFFTAGLDDQSADTTWMKVERTATTVDSVNISATAVQTNGVNITGVSTTATGTVTGCTTAPTTTVRYNKVGNIVVGEVDGVTCTSNATSFTMTGAVPAAFQPARNQVIPCSLQDNTTAAGDYYCVFSNGSTTLTFTKDGNGSGFTASGSKGTATNTTFSYILN